MTQRAVLNQQPNLEALLTEDQAAELLQLTPRTLQAWRYQGRGPRFVKISARAVRYQLPDLQSWIAERLRRSTSDPGPALDSSRAHG